MLTASPRGVESMAKAKKTAQAAGTAGKGEQNAPDPSIKSIAFQQMESKWAVITTLMGGTSAMRASERTYLPQHAEESNENYNERLNRCTLFNMFELTLDSLVGKQFVEPVKLNSDVPDTIAKGYGEAGESIKKNKDSSEDGLAKNIDLQGNDITSFCREWSRDAIAKGFSHVLIDMPTLNPEERAVRTAADDIAEKRRPYWTLIRPENVIFAYSEIVNGEEVLKHIRIREFNIEMQDFAEVVQERIRILEPGLWQLWQLEQLEDKKEPVWVKIEEGTSDLDYIPLVTFYANRAGFMMSKPPLEDLAHLNVRHWQSTSDQINILTVARFPMLAVSGAQMAAGQQENVAVGPRQLLATRDANGKFYYVEHNGKSIASGREDLKDLEDAMASYGAEFLRRKIGGRTATERALDGSESISPLKDITIRFNVAVNRALEITADWLDEPHGGTAFINPEFTEEDVNTAAINTLADARKRGDISRETWINEMKRLEVISPDIDTDAEMKRIEKEAKTLFIKPTFVTASEQIRSVETVPVATDQTPTDILNDTPGKGDSQTPNPGGGKSPPKPPGNNGTIPLNQGPTKGAAKPIADA